MAYVDQSQGKEKTVAFIATMIILAVVGYAFVTGLAYNVIKKAAKDLNVIDIQDQPPPPPEPPPPPPPEPQPQQPPPVVAPPPIVQPPVSTPPPVVTVPTAPPAPVLTPAAPPAPPAPPKPSQASPSKPRGNPGEWVTPDDYPPAALRNEEQGRTGFKLDVGPDGKATNCSVTTSSGHPDLDETACKLLLRRARFTPAKDAAGNGMASVYSSTVVWQIPRD
jgi:periplasmic protein TonB